MNFRWSSVRCMEWYYLLPNVGKRYGSLVILHWKSLKDRWFFINFVMQVILQRDYKLIDEPILIYWTHVNQYVNQELALTFWIDLLSGCNRLIIRRIMSLIEDARRVGYEGLKILWPVMAVRVQVPLRVLCKALVSSCLRELFLYNY